MMESKWLRFHADGTSPSGKTRRWSVFSKTSGSRLGSIRWFARWRQYTFDPAPGTTFNTGCLRDIGDFMESHMAKRRGVRAPEGE